MRWKNTETPSFAGVGGSKPAVIESLQLLDRDGTEVAKFEKAVTGVTSMTVDGSPVGGGGALTLATVTVDLELATKQNLLSAVPASTVRVIVRTVVRNASVDLTTIACDLLFGFNAGANDLGSSIDAGPLAALTDATKVTQNPIPLATTGVVGAAGDVFGCILDGTQFPSPATVDVDVLYYDVAL